MKDDWDNPAFVISFILILLLLLATHGEFNVDMLGG